MIVDPADERARLEREVRIHKRLRELLLLFSRNVSANLGLGPALDALVPEIKSLYGAGLVEIWLVERRYRRLVLAATTAPGAVPDPVAIEDVGHYAAFGMRLDRPRMRGQQLVAPLRGWRRALGTLIIERPDEPGHASALDMGNLEYSRDLARQLSAAIENVQLIDDIREGALFA